MSDAAKSMMDVAEAYLEAHAAAEAAEREVLEAKARAEKARDALAQRKRELGHYVGRNQPVKRFLVAGKVVRVEHRDAGNGSGSSAVVTVEELIRR